MSRTTDRTPRGSDRHDQLSSGSWAGALLRYAPRSRRTQLFLALAVAALATCVLAVWQLLPTTGPPAPQGTISLATGEPAGVYDRYGRMLRHHMGDDASNARLRLDRTRGSVDNIERLTSGRSQFGLVAVDALEELPSRERSQLRAVARLYADYIQLVVPADSDIQSAADLKGQRVAIGPRGSGVSLWSHRLLRAAGLDADRDVRAVQEGISTSPRQLRKGYIDAFFWSGGVPSDAVRKLSRHFRIRLIPLSGLTDALRQQPAGDHALTMYRSAVIPSDAYPRSFPRGRPVSTIAVANILVTRKGTGSALVEWMTSMVMAHREEIGHAVHAAQLVDLRTAIFTDPLPLHEGARRYYSSVKP